MYNEHTDNSAIIPLSKRNYKDTVFRMIFSDKKESTQININPGYNDEILDKCITLKDYMKYVDRVRIYQKAMPLENAVYRAVDECIKEGIIADFLKKNRAEVISMSIFEYDEKLHEKTMIELGREEGIQQGIQQGIIGSIAALRKLGWSDEQISAHLVEVYNLDTDISMDYINNFNSTDNS